MSPLQQNSQRGIRLWFVFLATFIAMFVVGSLLFQGKNELSPEEPKTTISSSTIKAFLILVDDLTAPSPAIDSMWVIILDTNQNKIFLLEVSDRENWDSLSSSFNLTEDFEPSSDFKEKANMILPDVNGYILMDRYAGSYILSSYIPDKIGIQTSSKINDAQMEAFCASLNNANQAHNVQIGTFIENNRLISLFETQQSVRLWEILLIPQQQRTCSIQVTD